AARSAICGGNRESNWFKFMASNILKQVIEGADNRPIPMTIQELFSMFIKNVFSLQKMCLA
ncbi:MAG: hypothetical protein ACRC7J_06460, partial [Vibrio ordalii]|uniref:hypothetical protein n=1 Tax=Vibrio ordalii TaxID=28174 RepID=UPI003F2D2F4D